MAKNKIYILVLLLAISSYFNFVQAKRLSSISDFLFEKKEVDIECKDKGEEEGEEKEFYVRRISNSSDEDVVDNMYCPYGLMCTFKSIGLYRRYPPEVCIEIDD